MKKAKKTFPMMKATDVSLMHELVGKLDNPKVKKVGSPEKQLAEMLKRAGAGIPVKKK